MDSATTAAIARREGFEVYALSVRYGQRHAVELEAARRVAARARRRRATWSSTSTSAPSAARRSPATSRCPRTRRWTEIGERHPGHLRAGPEHDLPLVRAGLGRDARRPRHLHRRQRPRLQRLSRLPARVHRGLRSGWRTWPPAPGSRAARLTIHTPLIALTKAEIVDAGLDAGRRLRHDQHLLRPGARRRGLRPLRRLPAPAQGLRGGRASRDPARYVQARATHDATPSRRSSTPCRARAPTPAGRRCSAASPAATCGPAARRIGPSAVCRFCDTDFVGTDGPGGGKFATAERARRAPWPRPGPAGDPRPPLRGLHRGRAAAPARRAAARRRCTPRGFEVAVETNGTVAPPAGIDWLCVSPKAGAPLVVRRRATSSSWSIPRRAPSPSGSSGLAFRHFFLQPMDGPDARGQHRGGARATASTHPRWRLSLQTHKLLGIP